MTTLITYYIASDQNNSLKETAKIACNFWNYFLIPEINIVIRLGIFTSNDNTIAQAWAPYTSNGVTYGRVEFNTVYLSRFSKYEIAGTIVHELGHTLGIGFSTWMQTFDINTGNFYSNYVQLIPGLAHMQVETDGGPGTEYSHWDEEIFEGELMTGYKDSAEHVLPISIDVMELFGHTIVRRLQGKTDLTELMIDVEGIQFQRQDEIKKINLQYFEETELVEVIPAST